MIVFLLKDFHSSPVVKTSSFQYRGHGFDSWLWNSAWLPKNKQTKIFSFVIVNLRFNSTRMYIFLIIIKVYVKCYAGKFS